MPRSTDILPGGSSISPTPTACMERSRRRDIGQSSKPDQIYGNPNYNYGLRLYKRRSPRPTKLRRSPGQRVEGPAVRNWGGVLGNFILAPSRRRICFGREVETSRIFLLCFRCLLQNSVRCTGCFCKTASYMPWVILILRFHVRRCRWP